MNIFSWLASLLGSGGSGGAYSGAKRKLKVGGKQLFCGLCGYHWGDMSTKDRRAYISSLVKAGWTGVSGELHQMYAGWPRGQSPTDDYVKAMKAHVDKLVPWVEDCLAAGLWYYNRDNNSNSDVNKALKSVNPLLEVHDYILKRLGQYPNLIRLPVSETDNDLKADIRAKYISRVEATWPDDRTAAMSSRRGACLWVEKHQGHIRDRAPGGGWSVLAVSDTGSILIELCGSVNGKAMNIPKAKQWVGSMLDGGNSVDVYALMTGVDEVLIKEVGALAKTKGV
jgi:hypothetical protein